MPRRYPGSTPGVDPGSQGVILRRFKRKKFFVTHEHRTNTAWTDRRDSRNSYVDSQFFPQLLALMYEALHLKVLAEKLQVVLELQAVKLN